MNQNHTSLRLSRSTSFVNRTLVVIILAFGLSPFAFANTDADLYEYLYPVSKDPVVEPLISTKMTAPGFKDSEPKPWTPSQLEEMKSAFKQREPVPTAPKKDQEEIRLWDLPEEPNSNEKTSFQGGPYNDWIQKYAQKYKVSSKLIALQIKQESRFNSHAISPKGNKGLMQISDDLAREFKIDAFDPESNINVGTLYMASMLKKYGGNVELALAAYNAGPTAVDKYSGIPPYAETKKYVSDITLGLN